jgi:hypothetical protein
MSYSESWGLIAYESEAIGIKTIGINEIDFFQLISTKLG